MLTIHADILIPSEMPFPGVVSNPAPAEDPALYAADCWGVAKKKELLETTSPDLAIFFLYNPYME